MRSVIVWTHLQYSVSYCEHLQLTYIIKEDKAGIEDWIKDEDENYLFVTGGRI